tara:strand:- start:1367 stop:1897 length:531 start_codon:yes stop_codon:yes gene_type:complete
MRVFNFFLFLLIFNFFNNPLLAHGPSRQKVSENISINADPTTVWEIVSNFKEFKWNSNIKKTIANDNNIGSERILEFINGEKIKQKLEKVDKKKMFVGWRILETDNKVLPVNSYAAKVFVKKNDDDSTNVNYKAGFYRGFMGNDPPEELNDENSKKKVEQFIKESLKGLKKIAEKN